MNHEQAEIIRSKAGFVAALDQSGGSTPKALLAYGVSEDRYTNEDEMFDLVHEMRTRVITSPAFNGDSIIGSILFEQTMDREIDGQLTADYLWNVRGIVPFLKVDQGMQAEADGVTLMKPIQKVDELLKRAVERNIFGTKMRSVIKAANEVGIRKIVAQQVEFAIRIFDAGLVPIIEPEVDINIPDKAEAENILNKELLRELDMLPEGMIVMLKLSIPTEDNLYTKLIEHPRVLRVLALSGGYSRDEANELLKKNHGLVASFSRALLDGLSADQSDDEFNETLAETIREIKEASIT